MSKLSELEEGKLLNAVESLTTECKNLNCRVRALELQLEKGKGMLSAVVLISSALGGVVATIIGK
tara:strand:- start:33 stop:227 length:195 start_codon:yes stop_codon:yes gene_type:complete